MSELERVVFEGDRISVEELAKAAEDIGGVTMVDSVDYLEVLPHARILEFTPGTEENGFVTEVHLDSQAYLKVATRSDFENYVEHSAVPNRRAGQFHAVLLDDLKEHYSKGDNSRTILADEAAVLYQTYAGESMVPLRLMEGTARYYKDKHRSTGKGLGRTGMGFITEYLENALKRR